MLGFRRKKDKKLGEYIERLAILGQLSRGPINLLDEEGKKTSKFLIFTIAIVYLVFMGVLMYYTKD